MKILKFVRPMMVALLSLFFVFSVQAQTKAVAGKIVDAKDGSAISGITVTAVTASGKKVAAVSSNDGTYKVASAEVITRIVVSGVGFEQQDLAVGKNTTLNVSLTSSVASLGDVVVVGYGTQKKKEITSAITRISAEEFNKGNINDVAQLLQGKVAGLSIARPGGNPNEGFAIRLRGLSTIGANTSPLVVVDGVVGADLNSIDPNDIKSVDVLKDGSAAAIYGTRGSAGVIIVTTKNGSRGGTSSFNYSSQVTMESPVKFTEHMDAGQYRTLIKKIGAGNDYGANTDWNKEITRNAITHVHNLSFSGGTDKTTFDVSMNYRNAEGIAINTGFQQLNGRVNLTHRALNDKLVFNIQLTSTSKEADLGFSNAFEYATIYNPTAPIHSKDPMYDLAGGGWFEQSATEYSNPVAMLTQNSNHQTTRKINFAGSVEYEIAKGLKVLTRYAQTTNNADINAYTPSNAFIDRGFYTGATGLGRHGYAWKQMDKGVSSLYENTLSYNTKVSKLDVNAVGGYSYQEFTNQGLSMGGGNFITDLSNESIGTAQDFQNGKGSISSYKNGSKLVAFFGRLNLNWDNYAYLSASVRQEGSTQFGPNNKWGIFPAVSGGVDLKKILNIGTFDALKVRTSYGVTGSLPPYAGLSQLTFTGQGNYLINGNWITTYGPNQNSNPDLKWEKKAEIDFGVDFALLNNRLTGTADYYQRTTTDLIFNVTVPSPPALFNRAWKNVGDLEAKGFELALNYKVITEGKLTWNTGVNYSTNKVTLTRLDKSAGSYIGETNLGSPGQEATKIIRTYEGGQVGTFYNAVYRGIDANGKYLFDDGKGNAVLSTATTYQAPIGNGMPKFEMGWSNVFTYGKFDFNFFLRGSFGHQLINTFRTFYENPANAAIYNVVNTKFFDAKLNDASIFSSLFVEKADFVKLDNATLGYTIPVSAKSKAQGIKSLRAFLTGNNLMTITNYTGADPEVRYSDGGNILAPGIDRRATWVMTRSFTLGINIGL
jgi:TonB-dependent starch-binding outer membrane protein SusC